MSSSDNIQNYRSNLISKLSLTAIFWGVSTIFALTLLKSFLNSFSFYLYSQSVDISNFLQVQKFQQHPPLFIQIFHTFENFLYYFSPVISGVISAKLSKRHKILNSTLVGFLWSILFFGAIIGVMYSNHLPSSFVNFQNKNTLSQIEEVKMSAISEQIEQFLSKLLFITLLTTLGGTLYFAFSEIQSKKTDLPASQK